MKESQSSETLWNEDIRRCEMIDIVEKVRETRLRLCELVGRDEGEPVIRDIME